MVGDDLHSLPAGGQQLSGPASDPLHLFVEVLDDPNADIVPSMIDLAGLRPGPPRGVSGLD